MAKKPKMQEMFGAGNDLPLFSATPQKVIVREFKPQEQERQVGLFVAACTVCFGSKKLTVKSRKGYKVVPCMYCS